MRENRQLSIMFADIAGSTKLYETIGDAKAREVTSKCIDLLSAITVSNRGRVIKTIGDEVMCTFPSADSAASASVQMQEDVEAQAMSLGLELHIRVGFHFGKVILEGGDVFGDAVNLAARMAAQAKGDQIITTGETLQQMSSHLRANSRVLITTTVKGKSKPIQICELTWGEEEELTIMTNMSPADLPPPVDSTLQVSFNGKEVEVSEKQTTVSMGRGKANTFVVPDNMSSRNHAKIEFRRGKIFLIDASTNGTYVSNTQGEQIFVHRDEHILEGDGVIGLGRKVEPSDPLAVHFS